MGNGVAGRNARARSERRPVDWKWIVDWLTRRVLPIYFALFSAGMLVFFVRHRYVGIDARIYTRAASTWLSGGDPWKVAVEGYYFAAPPPTLLPFFPFAALGETLSGLLWVAGSLVAGIFLIRRLRLPLWWLLFPPLINGVLAGNADVLLVALLVSGGSATAVLATFLKIYAIIPLVGETRWRALAYTVGALVLTAPFLPWGEYLEQSGQIAQTLARQAIGISAWGNPILMIGVAIALTRLGPRLASWLAVPAVWPSTQLHYSTLALPALAATRANPMALLVAAILFAPENRGFPALATMVLAIGAILAALRARRGHAVSR